MWQKRQKEGGESGERGEREDQWRSLSVERHRDPNQWGPRERTSESNLLTSFKLVQNVRNVGTQPMTPDKRNLSHVRPDSKINIMDSWPRGSHTTPEEDKVRVPVHTSMSTKFGSSFRSSPSVRSQDFLKILQHYREEGVITKYLTDVTHILKDHEDFIAEFGVHLTCVCCSGTDGRRTRHIPFLWGLQVWYLHQWLEHLKIETRLINEMFANVMGECVILTSQVHRRHSK
jgi:hypothetical protein